MNVGNNDMEKNESFVKLDNLQNNFKFFFPPYHLSQDLVFLFLLMYLFYCNSTKL